MRVPTPRNALECLARLAFVALLSLALPAGAAPVTFWFTGQVDAVVNGAELAPTGIVIGTQFDGRISYDPDSVSYSETNELVGGPFTRYNFETTTAYSFTLNIAGNTIDNISNPNLSGSIATYHTALENHQLYYETSSALTMNGISMVSAPNQVIMGLFLWDKATPGPKSTALPLTPPVLDQFSEGVYLNIVARNSNGTVNLFIISGSIQSISPPESVQLQLRRASTSTIQIAWPLQVSGYTLQSSASLVNPSWQNVTVTVVDTATEHTLTLPSNTAARYFRLRK